MAWEAFQVLDFARGHLGFLSGFSLSAFYYFNGLSHKAAEVQWSSRHQTDIPGTYLFIAQLLLV